MPTTYFSEYSLDQVHKPTIHPVLPEHARSRTEWCCICLDHAECSMNGPEDEEYDEQMMREPETLMVLPLESFQRSDQHGHQDREHDISRPPWAGSEIDKKKSFEALIALGSQLCKVVPVSNCMDPGEEDD